MAYACGAMDRVDDGGAGWRNDIEPFINSLGAGFLNPCDKPISIGLEDAEHRDRRHELKMSGDFESMSTEMKTIRAVDLRMVDIAHFLVVNINLDHKPCGTIEEIVTANRQRKPILIQVDQGKSACPDWILGMLGPKGHNMIFDTWEELKDYLTMIDSGSEEEVAHLNRHGRWVFFDFHKIFNNNVAGFTGYKHCQA